MKYIIIGISITIILIITLFSISKEVEVKAKCVDKFITWDKYGNPEYNIVYKREDNSSFESEVTTITSYYNKQIGSTYHWTERVFK